MDVERKDNECTCVISFKEENFEIFGQNFPKGRQLFPDLSSIDLDWRTAIFVLLWKMDYQLHVGSQHL